MITGTFSKNYFQWRCYRVNIKSFYLVYQTIRVLTLAQLFRLSVCYFFISHFISAPLTYFIYHFLNMPCFHDSETTCYLLCLVCPPFLVHLAESFYSSQSLLQHDFLHPLFKQHLQHTFMCKSLYRGEEWF